MKIFGIYIYDEDGFVPPKHWFYRPFMRLIHKYGFHYAPKQHMPQPYKPKTNGLDGQPIKEWYHWCHWCGLRGTTVDISKPQQGEDNG